MKIIGSCFRILSEFCSPYLNDIYSLYHLTEGYSSHGQCFLPPSIQGVPLLLMYTSIYTGVQSDGPYHNLRSGII